MLTELYGKSWITVHGATISPAWQSFLTKLSDPQLNRILIICHDRFEQGNRFPPVLGELITQINQRTESECREAYERYLRRKPDGAAEKWVLQSYSWNLKRAVAGRELETYIKYLREADAKERAGHLRTAEEELKALPVHSTVTKQDIEREKYAQSGAKHRFSDRIEKLRSMAR
ncbi:MULTISPECIES: hypothetical protein [Vibrio harveyi group]|uniref:hypothetical protein n=1 Tax=Vibrio harveyi group TaxID=717610 RepID=UPI0012B9A5D9|nr:hypothetical protein [Vibrio parahaemolyticus]